MDCVTKSLGGKLPTNGDSCAKDAWKIVHSDGCDWQLFEEFWVLY
jgi:hypothetical protein